MDGAFAELVALLRREIEQYRHLLALVRRERGRIIKGELTGLNEVIRKKDALTRELAELEASRASLLGRLAEELGEPADVLTLAKAAEVAPGDAGVTLTALLDEFRGVVGRLVAANDINRNLLNRSLEFVQGSLDLFRTVVGANPTYGASGQIEAPSAALAGLNQLA